MPAVTFKPKQKKHLLLAASLLVAAAAAVAIYYFFQPPAYKYKGSALMVWFYGERKDFWKTPMRDAAQDALAAAGTNANPILYANLTKSPGNGVI